MDLVFESRRFIRQQPIMWAKGQSGRVAAAGLVARDLPMEVLSKAQFPIIGLFRGNAVSFTPEEMKLNASELIAVRVEREGYDLTLLTDTGRKLNLPDPVVMRRFVIEESRFSHEEMRIFNAEEPNFRAGFLVM